MSAPSWWLFTDAAYAGGAEQYLEWLLDAAGPRRAGLWVVDRAGLRPWIRRQEEKGFTVDRIAAGGLASGLRSLRALAVRRRPALVHVNLPGPYDGLRALASAAARAGGAGAVVVTEHLPGVGRVGKRYWVKRLGVRAIDRAITVCEAHRAVLIQVFGYRIDRVQAIPNGVPDPNPEGTVAAARRGALPADLAIRERAGGPRFVQVGALDPRKGGDVLIEAAGLLRRQGMDFSIWMVGEGPARRSWEDKIRAEGLEEIVHLAGSREDVARIWAAADTAVLASHREGMPLSLLEACAHGLPIVASDVDGIGEVVEAGETGLLVAPGDARQLARALGELACDPLRREHWGRRARQRYEARFTLGRMIETTFVEYDAVLSAATTAVGSRR